MLLVGRTITDALLVGGAIRLYGARPAGSDEVPAVFVLPGRSTWLIAFVRLWHFSTAFLMGLLLLHGFPLE